MRSSSELASKWPYSAAKCNGVHLHGRRRDSVATPPMLNGNGAPVAVLGVDVGIECDQQSDDSAIAVLRRKVQRGDAIAVHGGAGFRCGSHGVAGPGSGVGPTGYPRIDHVWVSVNGKSTPCGLRVLAISLAARASAQTCEPSKGRGNGDCGRRKRQEIPRFAPARERTRFGTWRLDRHRRASARKNQLACGARREVWRGGGGGDKAWAEG